MALFFELLLLIVKVMQGSPDRSVVPDTVYHAGSVILPCRSDGMITSSFIVDAAGFSIGSFTWLSFHQ